MRSLSIIFPVFTLLLLASCGGGQQTEETRTQDCRFVYNHDSTSVKWTAYKFTEKVGVSGIFDKIDVSGTEDGYINEIQVISNAAFSIPVSSINSTVPDRDMKIREHFFGTMTDTDAITGRIASISEDSVEVEISMNGKTNPVSMGVAISGSELKLEGVIQLGDWGAQSSVEALNKICHDLHIGADGISLLWPEVKLKIRTVLAEKCD